MKRTFWIAYMSENLMGKISGKYSSCSQAELEGQRTYRIVALHLESTAAWLVVDLHCNLSSILTDETANSARFPLAYVGHDLRGGQNPIHLNIYQCADR